MPTDVRDLIVSAITAMTVAVDHVPESAWDAPTPCRGWTVRDVIEHITKEQIEGSRVLAAEREKAAGLQVAESPREAWRHAAELSTVAWTNADLDRRLALTSGPMRCGDYAEVALLELVVHRWDVQRGAGAGLEVDGAAVSHVLDWAQTNLPDLEAGGGFDPPVEVESEYAVDQLMALLGRDPRVSHP
jgi:uncharacterized protein (TIGR03086 family)